MYILLFLIVQISFGQPINVTKIKIGTTVSLNAKDGLKLQFANTQLNVLKMWDEMMRLHSNNTVHILGKPYKIEFEMHINDGELSSVVRDYNAMCDDPEIFVALIPPYSDSTIAADILQKCNKVAISPARLPAEFYDKHYTIYQLPALPDKFMGLVLQHLNYVKLTRVSIISGGLTIPFLRWSCNITEDKARRSGIKVVSRGYFNETYLNEIKEEQKEYLHTLLDEAFATNSEVLLLCALSPSTYEILRYIKANNYNFGAIIIDPDDGSSVPPEYSDYTFVVMEYHNDLRYSDKYYKNAAEFAAHYKRTAHQPLQSNGVGWRFFYAGVLVEQALAGLKEFSLESFKFGLTSISLDTIVGPLTFDDRNKNRMDTFMTQKFNNSRLLVWPPSVSTTEYILPVPKWKERVYDPSYIPAEWGIIGFTIISLVCSIAWIIFIIFNLKHSVLTVSLPSFLILICVGSLFIYLSIFFWVNHQLTDAACHMRIWFLVIGFCLLISPLVAKNFQVWRMWTAPLNASAVITTTQLFSAVMMITSVQIVFLVIFSIASDTHTVVKVLDIHRPSLNQESCEYGPVGTVMVALMVAYSGILVLVGLSLAWGTRNVTLLAYNESKILLLSMYNVTFFSLMGLIIILTEDQIKPESAFILRSICIIFSAFFFIKILMVNKFWLIIRNKTAKSRTKKKESRENYTKNASNSSDESNSKKINPEDIQEKVESTITISRVEYDKLLRIYKSTQKDKKKVINLEGLIGSLAVD